MIDIHSHILNNIDDGAEDFETSLQICRIAIENGTTDIIATPHIFHPMFIIDYQVIKKRFSELKNRLLNEDMKVKIHLGFECRINGNLINQLMESPEYTLCGNGKYFLLEIDRFFIPPPDFDTFIFESKSNGLQPILVHPERYFKDLKDISLLEDFVQKGIQIQVTAASLTGNYGKGEMHFTEKMLKSNIIHYVASDIHSADTKGYEMANAYEKVTRLEGEKTAHKLFINNPKKIIDA